MITDEDAIQHVDMLVREYALADDDKLTESAKELKKRIISKIVEWDTRLDLKWG